MRKKLSELLVCLDEYTLSSGGDAEISSLVFDSREVKTGSLFFALPGTHTTGNAFIAESIKSGAAAVVYEGDLDAGTEAMLAGSGIPAVRVASARAVMAPVSAVFYEYPSSRMVVAGVTGTEGKSSTVSFIWQLLRLCGHKAGFLSTVQYSLGGAALDNEEHQTTPEAPLVQKALYDMAENGCEFAVLEASSHGLSKKLNRLGEVRFDAGVMMNVTHEHLEFHGSYECYRDDKANLFRALKGSAYTKTVCSHERLIRPFGVVNVDDKAALYFKAQTEAPVYGFTSRYKNMKTVPPAIPDDMKIMHAISIESGLKDLAFAARGDELFSSDSEIRAPIPGAFNAYNLMAALITVSQMTGMTVAELTPLTRALVPVKGRMTVIDCGQPFSVIVDYAHTPSSFEMIFPSVRQHIDGNIISLFGSAGERDVQKRAIQGKIAAQYSDTIVLCDEDPRGERPAELLSQIADGCEEGGMTAGKDFFIIPNRKDAIRFAIALAQPGDALLLLGKSHEKSIIYKDYIMPYDEIQEVKDALRSKGFAK